MDGGFRVGLPALTEAADGMRETVMSMDRSPVRDVDAPADAFGHAGLASAVAGFCDRWDAGVTSLTGDAREIADRLVRCADAYRRAEHAAGTHLGAGGRLESAGDDPATP